MVLTGVVLMLRLPRLALFRDIAILVENKTYPPNKDIEKLHQEGRTLEIAIRSGNSCVKHRTCLSFAVLACAASRLKRRSNAPSGRLGKILRGTIFTLLKNSGLPWGLGSKPFEQIPYQIRYSTTSSQRITGSAHGPPTSAGTWGPGFQPIGLRVTIKNKADL